MLHRDYSVADDIHIGCSTIVLKSRVLVDFLRTSRLRISSMSASRGMEIWFTIVNKFPNPANKDVGRRA